MAEVIEIGTLYFNGRPQKVGVKYNGERLSLGPTVPGKAIQWVKANGLLIADRCVCTQISWGELDFIGLVFGTIIQIDGRWYLCRCLKVGAEGGVPNEWDAILEKVGESNDLWHWKDAFFWGQETLGNLGNQAWGRAVRGGYWASYWNSYISTSRLANIGFRPALEPLIPAPLDYGPIVGTEITPMGPDYKFVSGRLVAFTDYDLVLESPSPLPDACEWAVPGGKQIIVDRASVSWLREASLGHA